MTDGQLAVIGVGSIGSMALWQASRLTDSVVGFEAESPAHTRSAVGGDTRLFRMTYRGENNYYPILQRARELWRQLEAESSQTILTQCGGLSIGSPDGPYIPQLLESIRRTGAPHEILDQAQMAQRYPQHNLRDGECAVFDPEAGFLRTDRAVLSALNVAESNGATIMRHTPVEEVREAADGVVVSSGGSSWTFDRVIVAGGGWSTSLLPAGLRRHVRPHRAYLSWFAARDAAQFAPERFPIFIRISGDRSLYGTPTMDQVTVKATLDGRGSPTEDPAAVPRELTPEEIVETTETVAEFLPGLMPDIVRSDAYPDLYTDDEAALLGSSKTSPRIYCATGFSGTGFKMSSAFGAIAAAEALSGSEEAGFDFLRPDRFSV
ncbi:MAG TPA: N-methyl-L-tryptophan oxidase [Humibacter sp.]|nr:N-methyl-L-tryptophan oxidase [Humibacter sp.]